VSIDKQEHNMSFAIIGAGRIGQALAKAFARKDVPVRLAGKRPPEHLAELARTLGSQVTVTSIGEALLADTIFLAVPFLAHGDVAHLLPDWSGKTLVDVTNAYGVSPDELGDLSSSSHLAKAFAGARLVKGFNHLAASVLAQDPSGSAGRRVVFLSSNDDAAMDEIAVLADQLGFAPVRLGRLDEGGLLVQARGTNWGPLIFQDLAKVKGK
jgi:8-hydroxy-5-deazaflavin:NADPH oxidoreductase